MEQSQNTVVTGFIVEGMHCPKCEAKITEAALQVPGALHVSVDREGKRVTVTHLDESGLAQAIRSRIESLNDGKFTVTGIASGEA